MDVIKTKSLTRTVINNLKAKGFTLIEMLVVIAIIAILASMTTPSLVKAINTARAINCASKMRQIGVASYTYTNDYNNFLPHAKALSPYYFGHVLGPYMGYDGSGRLFTLPSDVLACSTDNYDFAQTLQNKPIISTYLGTRADGVKKDTDVPSGPYGGWQYSDESAQLKKLNRVTDNSVIMIETYASREYDGGVFPHGYNTPSYANLALYEGYEYSHWGAAYWHNGASNFLWKDGHVSSLNRGTQFDGNWKLK